MPSGSGQLGIAQFGTLVLGGPGLTTVETPTVGGDCWEEDTDAATTWVADTDAATAWAADTDVVTAWAFTQDEEC